jgi:hypothetical protein
VQAPPHAGEERLPQKAAPPRLSVFGGRALASPERVNLQAEVASRPCFDEKALGCRVFGPSGELNAGARCQVSLDESALKAALGVNDGPWCGQGPCALPYASAKCRGRRAWFQPGGVTSLSPLGWCFLCRGGFGFAPAAAGAESAMVVNTTISTTTATVSRFIWLLSVSWS